MPFNSDQLENYPDAPGVYLMKNPTGKVLYVGKAISLKKRLKQYFAVNGDCRAQIPLLLKELSIIDTIVVPTEKEALLLENTLIKQHKPKFNILLKDDKNYISLSIDPEESWPRLRWTRIKSNPKKGTLYFGPYTSAKAARDTFDLMMNLFPLRQCSNEELKKRTRPCLLYGIKKCIAPCVDLCTKQEYATYVDGAIDFLKGNSQKVCQELEKKMHQASLNLEFEKAGAFLKTITQIKHVTDSPAVSHKLTGKDTDVLSTYRQANKVLLIQMMYRKGALIGSESFFFEDTLENEEELLSSFIMQHYKKGELAPQELLLPISLPEEKSLLNILKEKLEVPISILHPQKGNKKELLLLAKKNAEIAFTQKKEKMDSSEKILLQLQEKLFLTKYPCKIECFDTSNLSGGDLVASMAAYLEGENDKKNGRLYHIKGINIPDDYAALKQVLTRRLVRAKKENDFPDLLIIDGGKGQLGIALSVLKELDIINIDVVSLVKDKARHDKGLTLEKVYIQGEKEPISFPFHSPLLFFLQKMRDEAHRKAITFHRKTREKKTIYSALESVPGIGPSKRKSILKHFGSVQKVLLSQEKDLEDLSGFTKKDIEKIKEHLKSSKPA